MMPTVLSEESRYWLLGGNLWKSIRRLMVVAILVFTAVVAPLEARARSLVPVAAVPSAGVSCNGAYHLVRSGETLFSIAARYSTTPYRIAVCNGLRSYTVYVGQTLLIPTGRPYRRGAMDAPTLPVDGGTAPVPGRDNP